MIRPTARFVMAALAAAALLLLSGAPATAQNQPADPPVRISPAPTPDHPSYGDLIEAIDASVNWDTFFDTMTAAIAREYAQVPEIAALEKEKPGLIDAAVRAMRPVFESFLARVEDDYRPRKRALLARYLTPSEAEDLTAFYRSPLGMKIVDHASRSMATDGFLEDLDQDITSGKDLSEVQVTSEQVASDFDKAVRSTTGAMSEEELAELARLAAEKPALLKLATIRGEMLALQTQMANEEPNAGEIGAIEQAAITAIEEHIGK
ncbi:MAG: DUF2059 domain-containing protein [Erythrobacter sp.]|uniref:DUF2059 domain-containing protein n=1 Tax=Erythrobacter sp. TaxID=1042 RepID=UPI0025F62C85|nr:DUF2059 domain-containing protein [Erythrobacter sp.]MCL9999835.1 DUF2059 domain-containing protein [Erythrobacter sp.]